MGGQDSSRELESIERLNLGAGESSWEIFTVPGLSARSGTLLSPLNDTELLIAGGYCGVRLSDFIVLDTENKQAHSLNVLGAFKFQCTDRAVMT